MNRKNSQNGIRGLAIWMVLLYAIGIYLQQSNQYMMIEYLNLKPHDILGGEISRIFTWILIPSSMHGETVWFCAVKLTLIALAGYVLERVWGIRRYNRFVIRGLVLTLIAAILAYRSAYIWANENVACDLSSMFIATEFSTVFVMMSSILILGLMLVRKNLRNYRPNFIVGIICLVAYVGMLLLELIEAFRFSRDGAIIMLIGIAVSMINVMITVGSYMGKQKKKDKVLTEEPGGLENLHKLEIDRERII